MSPEKAAAQDVPRFRPGLLSGRHSDRRPKHTTTFASEVWIAAPPTKVFDFCLDADSIKAMLPDRTEEAPGWDLEARLGGLYAFRYWVRGILPLTIVVRIEHLSRPDRIVDIQLRGFFRYWRHTHTCTRAKGGTVYRDHVEFATRFGAVVDRLLITRDVREMFEFRQSRMKELLDIPGT